MCLFTTLEYIVLIVSYYLYVIDDCHKDIQGIVHLGDPKGDHVVLVPANN